MTLHREDLLQNISGAKTPTSKSSLQIKINHELLGAIWEHREQVLWFIHELVLEIGCLVDAFFLAQQSLPNPKIRLKLILFQTNMTLVLIKPN